MASGAGTPWTDDENDATVADYFAMLAEDLAGRRYNKAEHNRRLQARIGRGRGAIEYKHGNISAVLQTLGAPWIDGYKPAPNFQHSLIDAVKRWLDRDSDWLNRHSKLFAPDPPSVDVATEPTGLFVGPPPTKSNAPPAKRDELQAKIAHAFDFAGRDQRNRALGQAGEALVFAYERGLDTAETDTRLSSIYEPCAPEAIVARYSACLAISARLLDMKAEGGAIRRNSAPGVILPSPCRGTVSGSPSPAPGGA